MGSPGSRFEVLGVTVKCGFLGFFGGGRVYFLFFGGCNCGVCAFVFVFVFVCFWWFFGCFKASCLFWSFPLC